MKHPLYFDWPFLMIYNHSLLLKFRCDVATVFHFSWNFLARKSQYFLAAPKIRTGFEQIKYQWHFCSAQSNHSRKFNEMVFKMLIYSLPFVPVAVIISKLTLQPFLLIWMWKRGRNCWMKISKFQQLISRNKIPDFISGLLSYSTLLWQV